MNVDLTILASTAIKRKKPCQKITWLGKENGGLYVIEKSRVSQLDLPSGKTRSKIPTVQPFLVDVQALSSSSNGQFLAAALKCGKLFVWERDNDSLHTTPVLDKIRNVLGLNKKRVSLFISNCGKKIVLLSELDQLFLWETDSKPQTSGEPFVGRWSKIQSGDHILPTDQDKESAVDGVFYEDHVKGLCFMVSWVFNVQDRICINTLWLQWSQSEDTDRFDYNYNATVSPLPFSAKWFTFVYPLYGLTPAKGVLKSHKAYIARFSLDGHVLAVAMNQKDAIDTRIMFYLATSCTVAIVTDLKSCGSQSVKNLSPTGRLWWVCDMQWTNNSLLLIIITRCGSVAMLTRLGEPLFIKTIENSLDMGPSLYLPLHPRMVFKKQSVNGESDSSLYSMTDNLRQRHTISVHPNLPIILTTDGYLVTILQLPGNVSYNGVIMSFLSSILRLVPEVKQNHDVIPVSSTIKRVDIFQSNTNFSRATEELSENTQSSCSSSCTGYGLASGDQGIAVMPIISNTYEHEQQEKSCNFLEALDLSIKGLAVGVSAGQHWSKDVSRALGHMIKCIVNLFSLYLQDDFNVHFLSSFKSISKFQKSYKLPSQKVEDCYEYFKLVVCMFLWDTSYRNSFSLSLSLIHGIIKGILVCQELPASHKISSSIVFLQYSENVLGSVYSWKQSSNTVAKVIDQFSPEKSIPRDSTFNKGNRDAISDIVEEVSQSETDESNLPESPQITKALSSLWLQLYKYIAQSCPSGLDTNDSSQFTQYLCDIQKKLQDMDIAIPSDAKQEQVPAVRSVVEQDDGIPGLADSPGGLFGRHRINYNNQETNESTPRQMHKTRSPDYLLNVSAIGKSFLTKSDIQFATATESLAILYQNLQKYNLKAALQLVLSLMEPALDHLDTTFSSLLALDSLHRTRTKDCCSSQFLSILVQTYPIIYVADKCGIAAVQSLARFMAAYFCNQSLFVYPAFHPNALPPYYLGEQAKNESTSEESFALYQGVEVVHLDPERVASAVRDQGLSDVWCADNAIEFMLISGLIGEAAWLSHNLGDWKHGLILSICHMHSKQQHQGMVLIPTIPKDVIPENIILTHLQPVLLSPAQTNIPKNLHGIPEDATSTPNKDRLLIERPSKDKTHLMDEKVVKDVRSTLEAAVVAGLDVVPVLCEQILEDLLALVSEMEWIVPEELYLPAPPMFCPQPFNVETEFILPHVYREKQLRSDIASSVQKLLTLLHSSNCMPACVQWYVCQLVAANENWHKKSRDDPDFIVPKSLMALMDITTTFHAADLSLVRALKRNATKPKDVPSPPHPSKSPGSSVSLVLEYFCQFCFVMWLLYVRDKMSLCARKYRQARNQATHQITEQVEGLCWETIRWTLELQPFGSFLGASARVSDSLLTLLSEMQPSITTAQITAQYFPDPNVILTTSGRAKHKRLMTQFRGITLREAGSLEEDSYDKPLSVFYREKCLEWQEELKERARLFRRVQTEVFPREYDGLPATKPSPVTNKGHPSVGSTLFETSNGYLEFLDTFFVITFTKTASDMAGLAWTGMPLLLPYDKILTFSEVKCLKELQMKISVGMENKPSAHNSLYRSQSCLDVRSNKARQPLIRSHVGPGQTDIRRSNSMNDISKRIANSGTDVLGTSLLEILPRLSWLSRWSSEGVPTTSINKRTAESQPVMKVDVDLPMVINSLWLLSNVYIPWELNEQVKPEVLKVAYTAALQQNVVDELGNDFMKLSPPIRASSDTTLPKVTFQSPSTEEDNMLNKEKAGDLKRKISKRTNQGATLPAETVEEFNLPRPKQNHDVAFQPKQSIRKNTKSCRKALNMDQHGEDSKAQNITTESHCKVKPSKWSPTKTSSPHDLDHVTVIMDSESEVFHLETTAPVSVHDNKKQTMNKGEELLLLLRANPNNQSSNSDVPLLKLSPLNQDQSIIPETKIARKDIALQTMISSSSNSVTHCDIDSKKPLTNNKTISTAVDFGAQYDERRDASCQTRPLSPTNREHHEPAMTNSSRVNVIPSDNPRQFSGATFNRHFVQVPDRISHPSKYHEGPYLQEHPTLKAVRPEQPTQNPSMLFPLLNISRTQACDDYGENGPPLSGCATFGDQMYRDSHPFPLLNLPKQTATQEKKTFRIIEVPPAARDLPLLRVPENQNKQHRPDLSKIKFADAVSTRNPCVMLQMDNAKWTRGPLVPSYKLTVPQERILDRTPFILLHISKEKPKPKLVPSEILAEFEQTKHGNKQSDAKQDKQNVEQKKRTQKQKIALHERENDKSRQIRNPHNEFKEGRYSPKDVRDTSSRQRRRQNMLSSTTPNDAGRSGSKIVEIKPANREIQEKSAKPKEQKIQLEAGLSEESNLELSDISETFVFSDNEQLYFNVNQRKPAVSNENVDEYCRELGERVKKQFEKELETLKKQQMELEIKNHVWKEKQREQDEVRERLEEERQLHERLERERESQEEKLHERVKSPRPVPRKRSVKWEEGSFVCLNDKPPTTSVKSQKNVEVQVQSDLTRVDRVTQTREPHSQLTEPQLERETSEQNSFAPVLPPDILLGLSLDEDVNDSNIIQSEKIEAERKNSVDKENTRQFVSVADIDNRLWEQIQISNLIRREKDERAKINEEEDHLESEDECGHSQVSNQGSSRKLSVASSNVEGDDEGLHKKHDPLTISMIQSVEAPRPDPNNARSLSNQRLSTRLQEMNERFEAIEKITQNMDREFHSSSVLLNAIESISEIMSPTVKSRDQKGRSTSSRRKLNKCPWRRDVSSVESQPKTSNELVRRVEVSLNEPEHQDNVEELLEDDNNSHDGTPTPEVEGEPLGLACDLSDSYDHIRDQTESRDSIPDVIVNDVPFQPHDNLKTRLENVLSVTSRSVRNDSLQDMMLSSDKLMEMFSDSYDSSKRTSQRSADKRKKVQDWMTKKRKERHLEWKKQVKELRAAEFKPFNGDAKDLSNVKKIKLAEKEREAKRRTRRETLVDERIKEASCLINEMLAEPVPKANIFQIPNYEPYTSKNKNKHNNRYDTKKSVKKIKKNTQPTSSQHRKTPLTSTPFNPNKENTQIYDSRFGFGARSVTPSGSQFVTAKTYRMHEKNKIRRSRELEREINQQTNMDNNGLYITDQSKYIDELMDQITDGSSIDGLNDIHDLLSDDSELKEILTDVLGFKNTWNDAGDEGMVRKNATALRRTATLTKNSGGPVTTSAQLSSKEPRIAGKRFQRCSNKALPNSPQSNVSIRKPQNSRHTTNKLSSNRTSFSRDTSKTFKNHEFGLDDFDDVSPWNTGDNLKMSDDVAQLLAEAKEAIGDNMSESSGSIMSNINWEAVDKIMNDM